MQQHLAIAAALHSWSVWESVISALLMVANTAFGWHVPQQTVMTFGLMVFGLVVGQHYLAGQHVTAHGRTSPLESPAPSADPVAAPPESAS